MEHTKQTLKPINSNIIVGFFRSIIWMVNYKP